MHYSLIGITDGLHYVINATAPESLEIAEIQQRYKCYDNTAVHAESQIIYSSKQGMVAITLSGEELLTGHLMTENEWADFDPRGIRIAYHDDRIYGFNSTGGFIYQIGADKRREGEFITHNLVFDYGYTDEVSRFIVFKDSKMYEWGTGELAIYDWKSHTAIQAGMWRPVTCKVVSPEFNNINMKGYEKAKTAYDNWKRENPYSDVNIFFCNNEDARKHYAHLVGLRPSVEVILYADGREYYRRTVRSNKPFLIPRKYKAIDWAIRVRGKLQVDEIHLQTSRESLVGQE